VFYLLKIFVFLVSVVAAAGGAYHLIFFKSENIYTSFWYGVAIMFVFSGLVYLWFSLYRKHKANNSWDVRLRFLGYLLAGLPALIYILIVVQQTYHLVQAKIFTSQTVINEYQEQPIIWQGFDSPVGIRISLTLDYPLVLPGYMRYPKLVMGKMGSEIPADLDRAYWKYCSEPVVDDSSCLTTPIWPVKDYPVLPEESPAVLSFDLYPSNLYYMENNNRVCLKKRNPYSEVSFVGLDKIVLWHFLGNKHKLDLTNLLTSTVREKSLLLKDIDLVQKMYRNAESGAFLAAGYQGCEIKRAIPFTSESECFCKESTENNEPKALE